MMQMQANIYADSHENDWGYQGAALELPATLYEVRDALQRARVPEGGGYTLEGAGDWPDFLWSALFGGTVSGENALEELNLLAHAVSRMDEMQAGIFEGAAELLDPAKVGKALRNSNHGIFTRRGYVYRGTAAVRQDFYDGEHLPACGEEHQGLLSLRIEKLDAPDADSGVWLELEQYFDLDIAANLGCYDFGPDILSPDAYGEYVLQSAGIDTGDPAFSRFDFRGYGERQMEQAGYVFTPLWRRLPRRAGVCA